MVWLTSMRRDAHFSIVLETESVRVRVSAMDMGIGSFQHLWFSAFSGAVLVPEAQRELRDDHGK